MTSERRRQLTWITVSITTPWLVALALVPLRDEMLNVNVALVLVLTVVAVARYGGRVAGAAAAVMSTLAFDVLHTQPYGNLRIASVDEIETTLLLAAVGLTVGSLASRARSEREATETLSDEVARIHRVTELIASGAPPARVLDEVATELTGLLALRSCRFERPPFATSPPQIDHAGRVIPVVHYHLHGEGFELPTEGVELAVDHRGETLGRFVMEPQPNVGIELEARLAAVAIADAVGSMLAHTGGTSPTSTGGAAR